MPEPGRRLESAKPHTLGGQKLRELRQAAGLSLLELTAKVEADLGKQVDAGHIDRIETGHIKKPLMKTLETILTGLHASYRDRHDILEAFGYAVPMTLPTESEIDQAKQLAAYALNDATYPVCLMDYGQRLWAWNRYTPRLIGMHPDDAKTCRFFGITTVDLVFNPSCETRLLVANPEEYLPVMLQFIKVGIYRFREEPGYKELLDKWRTFPGFSTLWESVSMDTLCAVVPIMIRVPGCGVLQFRISVGDSIFDSRFLILHFTPFGARTLRACAAWAEEEGML